MNKKKWFLFWIFFYFSDLKKNLIFHYYIYFFLIFKYFEFFLVLFWIFMDFLDSF